MASDDRPAESKPMKEEVNGRGLTGAWKRSRLLPLAVVFLVALLPRLSYLAFDRPQKLTTDEERYLKIAHTLWFHGVYGENVDEPYGVVSFLYPLLLSPFVGLFGPEPTAALLCQIVLACATACITFQLADRLHGRLAGWLAGLLCAAYLPMVKHPSRFLNETLALFLVITALLLADYLVDTVRANRRLRLALALGVAWGLAALTRTVLLPLVAVSFCLPAVQAIAGTVLRRRACCAVLCMTTSFCLVYGTWVFRNYITLGEWTVSSSAGNSLPHESARVHLLEKGYTLREARRHLKEARRNLSDAEWRAKPAAQGGRPQLSFFSTRYLRDCGHRLAIMLGAHPALEIPFPFTGCNVGDSRWGKWPNYLWTLAMFVGVAVALFHAAKRRDVRLLHAWAVPFALILLHAMVHAIARYQIIPYAAWTVCAGVGWALILGAVGRVLGIGSPSTPADASCEDTECLQRA